MRKSYIREKRTLCGDTYQAVGIYPVTDQEHRQRGKKRKESDKGQKSRNKAASLRRRLRKVLANFDQNGFYLTATYETTLILSVEVHPDQYRNTCLTQVYDGLRFQM